MLGSAYQEIFTLYTSVLVLSVAVWCQWIWETALSTVSDTVKTSETWLMRRSKALNVVAEMMHSLTSSTWSQRMSRDFSTRCGGHIAVCDSTTIEIESTIEINANWNGGLCREMTRVVNFLEVCGNFPAGNYISKRLEVKTSIIFIQIRRYSWEPC